MTDHQDLIETACHNAVRAMHDESMQATYQVHQVKVVG